MTSHSRRNRSKTRRSAGDPSPADSPAWVAAPSTLDTKLARSHGVARSGTAYSSSSSASVRASADPARKIVSGIVLPQVELHGVVLQIGGLAQAQDRLRHLHRGHRLRNLVHP